MKLGSVVVALCWCAAEGGLLRWLRRRRAPDTSEADARVVAGLARLCDSLPERTWASAWRAPPSTLPAAPPSTLPAAAAAAAPRGGVTYVVSKRRDGALGLWDDDEMEPGTGLRHQAMCLANLILLAARLNRTAVLPPPWHVLAWEHSERAVPATVRWRRYYDLESPALAARVSEPGDLHGRERGRWGGVPAGAAVVDPSEPWASLAARDDDLLALHFYYGWGPGGDREPWDCAGAMGGVGVGWLRDDARGGLGPSAAVRAAGAAGAALAADGAPARADGRLPFAFAHVRRGDVLAYAGPRAEYWGAPGELLRNVTSAATVALLLDRAAPDLPLVVATNDRDPAWFAELRAARRGVVLDARDLLPAAPFADGEDNNFAYEASLAIGGRAALTVATRPCYLPAARGCDHTLFALFADWQGKSFARVVAEVRADVQAEDLGRLFSEHDAWDDVPAARAAEIEADYLGAAFGDTWARARAYFSRRPGGAARVADADADARARFDLALRYHLSRVFHEASQLGAACADASKWYDGTNGCDYYDEDPARCELTGATAYNDAGPADAACCACGGGTRRNATG